MKNKCLLLLATLVLPLCANAEALWGNDLAGDRKLPRTWGIGIDYFGMRQPYALDSLQLIDTGVVDVDLGAVLLPDPSIVPIENEIRHSDIKLDVWLTPFLNVFAIYGQIDGDTTIDLGVLGLPLPPATNTLSIDYDGSVYGGGIVFAVGGDRWFASVTGTVTDSSLSGDFKSSVSATTIQTRLGLRFGDHTEFWIGGYLLEAEERHSGMLDIDLGLVGSMLPPPIDGQDVAFEVDLSQKKDFNASFGAHMMMSDAWEATVEVGGGDRRTVLANLTYRFE
ncbi:MAG: hypothetical protein OER22_03950 [Gammaproteobacteria bacterium]|nr:hypothetical protein [Gammaproteobacteria bacterium]MDH3372942.1 hypothetical protein [Gammaproteobacteria bacterium]MDH3551749.1 hypothetical protein [Gammaproteobacteria bacterium]